MTKKRKSLSFILSGLILLFAFSVYSQITDTLYEDSLCAYTWNSDINDCPEVLTCIYPDKWNDTIIDVQANITHISKDGLKLCLEDLMIGGSAEIIYIMDLSGSMVMTGDPYKKRPKALQTGFQYQIDSAKSSRAGYIGFSTTLQSDQLLKPVAVNNQTGINSLNLMVQRLQTWVDAGNGSGTNYTVAVGEAINYFNDPGIMHDSNQAIIFISDGEPNNNVGATAAQVQTLINRKIPVYGIFLGSNIGTGLDIICTRTNGKSYLVRPGNNDTLALVVKEIVKSLTLPYQCQGVNVNNSTLGINGTGVSFTKIQDTIWQIVLDKPLPLKSGLNLIQLNSLFSTPSGNDTTMTFKFTINVGGDTAYKSECYYCWYRTQMDVYDPNNTSMTLDTLTFQNNSYTLKLFYYGEDSLKIVNVRMKTVTKGDSGTITMTNPSFDGIKWTFTKTVPFKVISGNPTQNNDTTEADFEDLVTFRWRHPTEVMDTAFTSVIVKAPPNRMEIHNKAGTPTAASKYPTSPAFDTVVAGIDADLYAKVFANTKWLSDYENIPALYQKITWKCTDINGNALDPAIGFLKLNNVAHNIFHPRRALTYVDITATLTIAGLKPIDEKIRLYIIHGEPTQLVIEASKVNVPAIPTHYSPITILKNQVNDTAYAILRDSIGNFCTTATLAAWSSEAISIVTVDPGPSEDGYIHKQGSGQTIIHAVQSSLEDTAIVICVPYTIDAIRIVRVHNYTDTADITNLLMTTNQDTTLHVLGKTSDFGLWIPIGGDWSITDPAAVDVQPPKSSPRWSFSPTKPDTGIIVSSYDGTNGKLYDTVNYYFTPGELTRIQFTITTPDSLIIAGQKIKGLVEIFNEDGYIPGIWKYPKGSGQGGNDSADYTDILDAGIPGINGYIPYARTFNFSGALLDSCPFISKKLTVEQWFLGGIDTLEFVLYNTGSVVGSPSPKPHRLTVYLDALSASTKDFIVKPGPLDTIVLDPDTLPNLTPNDLAFIIKGIGYDKYGNYLPNEIFSWTNDTSLFDFLINSQSTQIFIDPSDATDDQEGWIYVEGISDSTVQNKVYIKIVGPRPKALKVITRDNNGNGFLDVIEILLDKPVRLPPGYVPSNAIVQKGSVYIRADSLTIAPLSNDKKLLLHLSEIQSAIDNQPQTGWTPLLTIIDCDSIQKIDRKTCEDGAAPVVWTAVKDVKDVLNRKKDVVTITLSENFKTMQGIDIVQFVTGTPPKDVINVWMGNTTVKLDSMLAKTSGAQGGEINQFKQQLDNWCIFNMTNGNDLNSPHFVNINDLKTHICDAMGNVPHALNQKVRVRVTGNIGDIIVAPIPIIPNLIIHNQIINDPLIHWDSVNIINIIKTNGGALITIPITGQLKGLQASLMVFDAAANLVFSQQSVGNMLISGDNSLPDWMIKTLTDPATAGSIVNLNFYWSGCTSKGMKSAPGVYKLIVYFVAKKDSGKTEKRKYGKTVAVGRE